MRSMTFRGIGQGATATPLATSTSRPPPALATSPSSSTNRPSKRHCVAAEPLEYISAPKASYRLLLSTLAEPSVMTPAVPLSSNRCHSELRR